MALLDAYFFFARPEVPFKHRLRRYWWAHMIKEALTIVRRYPAREVGRATFHVWKAMTRVITWNWESAV